MPKTSGPVLKSRNPTSSLAYGPAIASRPLQPTSWRAGLMPPAMSAPNPVSPKLHTRALTESTLKPRPMGASLLIHAAVITGVVGVPLGLHSLWDEPTPVSVTVAFAPSSPIADLVPELEELEPQPAELEPTSTEIPDAEAVPYEMPVAWGEEPDFEWIEIDAQPISEEQLERPLLSPLRTAAAQDLVPEIQSEALAATDANPAAKTAEDEAAPEPALAVELPPEPKNEHCLTPAYPAAAQRRALHGAVVCLMTVDAKGRVSHVAVEQSSGHELLDDAACEGLATWSFRPGTRDGCPVEMVVRKRLEFRLPK
ncbi:MAG: protein TonB [Planctomycetota bacterium]|jgi:protein TonB